MTIKSLLQLCNEDVPCPGFDAMPQLKHNTYREDNWLSSVSTDNGFIKSSAVCNSVNLNSKRKSSVEYNNVCKKPKNDSNSISSELLLNNMIADIALQSDTDNRDGCRQSQLPITYESQTPEAYRKLFTSLDEDGNTTLHFQILKRDYVGAVQTIEKASNFQDLNVQNSDGQTALHLAAATGQDRLVRMLMCAGAPVSEQDELGNTPLHLACMHGHTEVAQCLLKPIHYTETRKNKYEIPFSKIPQDLTIENDDELICSNIAKSKGFDKIVHFLQEADYNSF